jgi:hypothetical protein
LPLIYNPDNKVTLILALIGSIAAPCCLALIIFDFLTMKISKHLKYGQLKPSSGNLYKNTLIPDRKTSFRKKY